MSVLRRPRGFPRRRHRSDDEDPLIFAGSASPRLTAAVCRELEVELGASEVIRFSEGTLFVRVLENVRGRSVYLVQSTVFPTNANFMELLFWIDAFSRASADSVTVIVPYFSYAKGDKKDEPRVSIRARVCADALAARWGGRVGRDHRRGRGWRRRCRGRLHDARRYARGGRRAARCARCTFRYGCGHARGLRAGIHGPSGPQPDRAPDRDGLDRDAAR